MVPVKITNLFDEDKFIQCEMLVDMGLNEEDSYEPLLGYVILEQAQVAVDMLGHRLVPVRYIDMK